MADTVFPTSVKFLLAEESREERSGKMMLIGFNAANAIVVLDGEETKDIESLEIIGVIDDGVGEFQARIELLDPNNNSLLPAEAAVPVRKIQGITAIFKVRLRPFGLKGVGDYIFKIWFGENCFEHEFKVATLSQLSATQRANLDVSSLHKK